MLGYIDYSNNESFEWILSKIYDESKLKFTIFAWFNLILEKSIKSLSISASFIDDEENKCSDILCNSVENINLRFQTIPIFQEYQAYRKIVTQIFPNLKKITYECLNITADSIFKILSESKW